MEDYYESLYAEYPEDTKKEIKIDNYIDEMKSNLDLYERDYQDSLYDIDWRLSRKRFEYFSDSELEPFKNKMKKEVKKFSGKLQKLLDKINRDLERYISSGISEKSVNNLIDLINYVYNEGESIMICLTNLGYGGWRISSDESIDILRYDKNKRLVKNFMHDKNKRPVVKFYWSTKYMDIHSKWYIFKNHLPSNEKERNKQYEKEAKERLQNKLIESRNDIKKIEKEQKNLIIGLKEEQDNLIQQQKELEQFKNNYKENLDMIKNDYYSKDKENEKSLKELKSKLEELEDRKRKNEEEEKNLFVLNFLKKRELQKINNKLNGEIYKIETKCKEIKKDNINLSNKYKQSKTEIKNQFKNLNNQVISIENRIVKFTRDYDQKSKDIETLSEKISHLECELKDFHKNYLLKNCRRFLED